MNDIDNSAFELEAQLMQVMAPHRRMVTDSVFAALMSKIDDITHGQRVELFNALVVRIAGE